MAVVTHLMIPGRPESDSWIEADLTNHMVLGSCYYNEFGHKYRFCRIAAPARRDGDGVLAKASLIWSDPAEFEVTNNRTYNEPGSNYTSAGVCEITIDGGAGDTSSVAVCILIKIDGPAIAIAHCTTDEGRWCVHGNDLDGGRVAVADIGEAYAQTNMKVVFETTVGVFLTPSAAYGDEVLIWVKLRY